MQVVVDSLLTTYEKHGKGKTVLLIHGWADRATGLRQLQADLAKQYTVIALDLPGFGGTQAPPMVWGLDDYARFVAAFLQKIDRAQVHALVGHSNGGAIIVRAVAKGWLSADSLVLLSSAGIRGEQKGRLAALRYLTKAGKAITMPFPKATRQKLRRQVYKVIKSDMLVAEHLQETFKRVVSEDIRADATQITIPSLLIYGDQDAATPLWFGQALHQAIAGSTLQIMTGAGHFVHLDRPTQVSKAITEFIA